MAGAPGIVCTEHTLFLPGTGECLCGAGLHVLYKEACFTVLVAVGDPEANLERAMELARAVIARLP